MCIDASSSPIRRIDLLKLGGQSWLSISETYSTQYVEHDYMILLSATSCFERSYARAPCREVPADVCRELSFAVQ